MYFSGRKTQGDEDGEIILKRLLGKLRYEYMN